jgi:site-specific DNA recombinase
MIGVQKQIKVAIYLRVSTDDQKDKYGLEAQEDSIRAYIQSRGTLDDGTPAMVLAGSKYLYQDDISGTIVIEERPAFSKLKEDLESAPEDNKPFDAVIVYKVDRLARKLTVLLDVVKFFEKNKIQFISVNETIDTSTPFGRAILNIMGVIAELEIETIKQRTQAGREVSINKGTFTNFPPYGYKKDKEKKLVIFETEAKTVRTLYNMCLFEDKNPKQLADWLKDSNIISPGESAKKHEKHLGESRKVNAPNIWSTHSVRSLLSNEIYLGKYYYGKSEKRGALPKDKWKLSTHHHPRIIEDLVFEQVQEKLKASANKTALNRKRSTDRLYYLSGLLRCGYCKPKTDGRLAWQGAKKVKNGHWSYCYMCGHKNTQKYDNPCPVIPIPAEQLENYVIAFVVILLQNPKAVYDYQLSLKSSKKHVKLLTIKRDKLIANIDSIPTRKEKLSYQHEHSQISDKDLSIRLLVLRNDERDWQKNLKEINDTLGKYEISRGYTKSFELYAKKYKEILSHVSKNPNEVYNLIHSLIAEIIVYSRPFNPKFDRVPGRKKVNQTVIQQIPNEIEIVLKLPKAILSELVKTKLSSVEFGVRNDDGCLYITRLGLIL